jgi:hypothetical protein
MTILQSIRKINALFEESRSQQLMATDYHLLHHQKLAGNLAPTYQPFS